MFIFSTGESRNAHCSRFGISVSQASHGLNGLVLRNASKSHRRKSGELTRRLAEAKAHKIAAECPGAVIVAGDAVAAKGKKIFEKPQTKQEAISFLKEFSGSQFRFVTAIAVLNARTNRMLSTVETLDISFRPLLDREIQQYINQYDVLNYAGAFDNDAVLLFAERIAGSYNIGTALSPSRLIVLLREQGVEV